MNKKLIAMAIAAVVAAPAAMANTTTMYGKVHLDLTSNSNIAGADHSNYQVDSNASRLGVKGSEDLGNGLKAIWQMEFQVDMVNNGGATLGGRNTFLGLTGDFGTVLAGEHDTPAKIAWYSVGNDIIADSIVDMNNVAGTHTFTELRAKGTVAYVSPTVAGFTFAGAVVPGASKTGGANGLANGYSLAGMYSGMGLKVGLGYEVIDSKLTAAGNYMGTAYSYTNQKVLQLSASYTLGAIQFGGTYQKTTDVSGVSGADINAWGLAAKYSMGNNYVMANYAHNNPNSTTEANFLATTGVNGVADPLNTTAAKGFGVGVGHKFSKRTQVYVAYHETQYSEGGLKNPTSFGLGMIHTF